MEYPEGSRESKNVEDRRSEKNTTVNVKSPYNNPDWRDFVPKTEREYEKIKKIHSNIKPGSKMKEVYRRALIQWESQGTHEQMIEQMIKEVPTMNIGR